MATSISASDKHALPAPEHKCAATLDDALKQRRSVRDFDASRPLTASQLSDLLWAAAGINRPDDMHRTNPTALNKQEISIYVFTPGEVSLWNFEDNTLSTVAKGDHRSLLAGTSAFSQDFVKEAPVVLLLVADAGKFDNPDAVQARMMAMADAGIVCQNINLWCAASGLATVPRATMDAEGLRSLLGLGKYQFPALNNPVGYEKR